LTDSSRPDPRSNDTGVTAPSREKTVFFGKGMIAAIIGIVVLLVILVLATSMGSSPGQETIVPPQKCSEKVITYVNNNLVQPGTTVSFISVNESKGLYEFRVKYQSQEMPLYTTKDCSQLFTSALNMNAAPTPQTPVKKPVKTARPTVDLYVMSFCPYGTQAETVMRPVYDLLGSKADIRIRYITTVRGTTLDTVDTLHGPPEAKEDAYQVCLLKSQPALYWEYLRMFNEQCYPQWQNSEGLEICRKNVTATLGVERASLEACSSGTDAIALLKTDAAASDAQGASASPTLIINDVKYSGARTPEAYKQAICNSFETVPAECSTTLSGTSAADTGKCA